MNSVSPRSTTRREARLRRRVVAPLSFAGALALVACASDGGGPAGAIDADGRPTEAMLQRVANSALPNGNAMVRFVDGVAYVTGNVQTAIDANAVARALRGVEGVERVEMRMRREM